MTIRSSRRCWRNWPPSGFRPVPLERIERGAESFEAGSNRLGGAAEAQPKVLWLLEELARHDAGLELLSQQFREIGGAPDAEPRKNRSAEPTGLAFKLRSPGEELIDQSAVGLEQALRPLANAVELVEGHDRDLLRRVNVASISEVDDLPHPSDQLGLGENPTAPDATQPVGLRQATGDDEVRAQVKGRTPGLVEDRFQVNFVHQDTRSDFRGHLTGPSQSAFVGEGTAGIV